MVRASLVAVEIALIGLSLSGCDDRTDQGPGNNVVAPVKKYGTLDPADLKRPVVRRKGALMIEGCCIFKIGNAKASALQSDSEIQHIESEGYHAEISFGFHDDGEAPDRPTATTVIDGVTLAKHAAADKSASQRVWTAQIPVSAAAKKRGVVDPRLRIAGKCSSPASCQALDELAASVRF